MASSVSNWFSASTNRKVLRAMLTIGTVTVILRVIGMAKEIIIANYFGVGIGVDAFMIAMILPTIALNSVVKSLPTAMMPVYVQVKSEFGPGKAASLFGNVAIIAAPLFLGIVVLIYLFGPMVTSLIGGALSSEARVLTHEMLFLVTPIVFITGFRLLLSSLLNAEERFALVAAAPSFTAISVILAVVFFNNQLGVHALAVGTVFGATLSLVLLIPLCTRLKIGIRPRWSGFSTALQRVLRQFGPLAFGGMLLTSNLIIDQAMAATLGPGSVSSLGFGNRITTVMVGLGTVVVASAIYPFFSKLVAQKHWQQIRHTLFTYARLLAILTIPVTALLLFFSDEIISLLFERGKFSASDTQIVGTIQFYYALQIPFHVIAMLAVRLISALQKNKILMWGTAISLALNIALNIFFMRRMGVAGIALSTACVHAVSFTYLWLMLYRVLPNGKKVENR